MKNLASSQDDICEQCCRPSHRKPRASFRMRSRSRRLATAVGLALMGGIVMSGPGVGCASFALEQGLSAVDFCFIFDCQNGILGGTIDPCAQSTDANGDLLPPLFADCP